MDFTSQDRRRIQMFSLKGKIAIITGGNSGIG
ncbi:MAG: short-chain dehydrogenase [Ruminiclostridium sp.]|nr:short-chain dehydrogenase [Ruminiclostridium sp.]